MKIILDRIISPSQSAFVPGQLISDNILLAFELNHFLNSKTRGEQGWMALKLDVSKAYDKVEWSFLEHVMSKLGFPLPSVASLCFVCRVSHILLCLEENSLVLLFLLGASVRGTPFHLTFFSSAQNLSALCYIMLKLSDAFGALRCVGAPLSLTFSSQTIR
ncbi:UNVERIFIED_CONTAM: hypothetical protein Sradi_4090000 [Sesamum radiatum]|uniref:Reverse transcriptase domain-containing protein n=1 Tax=Sesamum radiatum TaxID=300843 RepID=A0AAW2PLI5_SESRA